MLRRTALLLSILPAALASYLTGYSTTSHFPCLGTSCPPHPATLSQSALPSLLTSLTTGTATSTPDLPLAEPFVSPELSLVVHAPLSEPASVLQALSTATTAHTPTSFVAKASFSNPVVTHTLDEVVAIANEASLLHDGKSDIVQVHVSQNDIPQLLDAVRKMASNLQGGLVVLWASREDAEIAPADGATGPLGPDVAPEANDPVPNVMRPPEIESSQLVGLLVALVFLLIFLPGFMCLSNIQPPQTFEAFDANDAKKKMQ